jgi:NitT/TauT family transport system substrate-binding protein
MKKEKLIPLLVILALGVVSWTPFVHAQAKKKVTLTEDWILYGAQIPEFVARAKGYYAEEGLEVDIVRGYGPGDTVKRVAAGSSEFGRSAGISDIMGRMGGAKIKIIAVPMLTPPFGVVFLESSGIKKPKDLEGKKLGAPAASSAFRMLPAFAKETGVDFSKIEVVNMGPASLVGSLAVKSVDVTIFWPTEMPAYAKAAKQRGEKIRYMLYADYGVKDMYGNTFITSDAILAKSPKAVRGFVRASLRGLARAIDHPDEAVDSFMKYSPAADRAVIKGEWIEAAKLAFDDLYKKNGLGLADPGKMKASLALVKKYFDIKGTIKPEEVYTNEFVEATPRKWRTAKKPSS